MSFSKVIPLKSTYGNSYLLRISEYEYESEIPVYHINFTIVEKVEDSFDLNLLHLIGKELISFLSSNDIILFYYCDMAEIQRSKRNLNLSPQKFRFNLFNLIFERLNNDRFLKDDVIIENNGEHFISLISSQNNKSALTQISIEIEKLNDK